MLLGVLRVVITHMEIPYLTGLGIGIVLTVAINAEPFISIPSENTAWSLIGGVKASEE